MNAGSFVLGLLGGIIYCEFRKGNLSLHNNKVDYFQLFSLIWNSNFDWYILQILFLLWHSIVPSCMIGLLTGSIFINNDFEKPALWIVAYYILIRNMCGYFLPILVIGIATGIGCKCFCFQFVTKQNNLISIISIFHLEGIVRDILRLPIFRTLGRLTFAAYIVHPLIIRLCSGSTRTPFSFSYLKVVSWVASFIDFSEDSDQITIRTLEYFLLDWDLDINIHLLVSSRSNTSFNHWNSFIKHTEDGFQNRKTQ